MREMARSGVVSDRCPILFDSNKLKWGPGPFRFENMWLELLQEVLGK